MKRKLLFGLLILMMVGCNSTFDELESEVNTVHSRSANPEQESLYYYYNGEKVFLKIDMSSYFTCDVDDKGIEGTFYNSSKEESVVSDNISIVNNANGVRHYSFEKQMAGARTTMTAKQYLKTIQTKANRLGKCVSPCILAENGEEMSIAPEFYVKLKSLADTTLLSAMAKEYDITLWKQNKFMPLWFTVYVDDSNALTSIELSNAFYESGAFSTTSPGFVENINYNSNDTYYSTQWGLNNTGQYGGDATTGVDINADGVTRLANGNGIYVGVIDTGIDYSHPDLNNASFSYDAYKSTEYSSKSIIYGNAPHGTCCAGIIGALADNSAGVMGVAPLSQLVSISMTSNIGSMTSGQIANAFSWAKEKGISVLSCSWGVTANDILTDAINDAATNGRNGYGCVIVFASGNDNISSVSYPSSLENVISVGAIDTYGKRKSKTSACGENEGWGSNYGTNLNVVAPGILISTTDITGTSGINSGSSIVSGNSFLTSDFSDNNYTNHFSGTSSATPFVSGLAALILSKNKYLKGSEVRDIIYSTCQKLKSYSFKTTSNHSYGTWNNEVGYGLIDAFNAVLYSYAYPTGHVITGSDAVSSSYSSYIVNKLPTSTYVQWSVDSSYFTVNRNGYNSAMVKCGTPGVTATLKAEIVMSGTSKIIKTITKTITSI